MIEGMDGWRWGGNRTTKGRDTVADVKDHVIHSVRITHQHQP
jgi:hypothetical protein